VPSGSWYLLLNPISKQGAYTFQAKDGARSSPAGDPRRSATRSNWLIDRKKIGDEILLGAGRAYDFGPDAPEAGTTASTRAAKNRLRARGNEKKQRRHRCGDERAADLQKTRKAREIRTILDLTTASR
jgi:hypothetical protein